MKWHYILAQGNALGKRIKELFVLKGQYIL
jgi:hypothetical protein